MNLKLLKINLPCGLIREIWSPLTLKNLKSLTSNPGFPDQPSVLYNIDRFSTPREKGKRFGQRIHGFFTAPENGLYMFAVSCSDECKLFLSTDDNEAKKQEIITHPTDGARDMSSEYINLKAGRSYYIESQSIQNEWVSPIRVGVRLPNGTVAVPISKDFLRPQRAGLYDEIFYNVSSSSVKDLIQERSFPDTPSTGKAVSDFDVTNDPKAVTLGHHISGYFFATETGKYKFFGACSQSCKLFLSSDETCNKRSIVLDYKSSKELPKFDVSGSVDLEAGLHYFIDALQVVKRNEMNSMKMGVVMPSGKTSFPIRKSYLQQFKPDERGVIREVWTNVKGQDVRDLTAVTTYPDMPSSVNILQSFDAPYNERYNYGQRIRGQFVAPMTGDYRFVISCDKQCEFWMSNSPNPEHKERILRQTHITSRHQFERYPNEQISSPVHMDIGEQYYIEAVHKAATGLDHLSVGVTLPNGDKQWPIPEKYLRVKHKNEADSHLKDPPCSFKNPPEQTSKQTSKSDDGEKINSSNNINNSNKNTSEVSLAQPSNLVHGYDELHKPYSTGEVGRIKGNSDNSELELDLGPEASHKLMHDIKSKEDASAVTPTIDLDDEMTDLLKKPKKPISEIASLFNAASGLHDKIGDMLENDKEKKLEKSEDKLANLLNNFDGNEKVKIIRLKTNKDLTDEEILNSLKQMSPSVTSPKPNKKPDSLTDTMDALGTFSNGLDIESKQLAQIPPEDAQRVLTEMNKPKPRPTPPRLENSDGIKVAGDTGGNLQIMEQNPFSNSLYGSKTAHDLKAENVASMLLKPQQTSLLNQKTPVMNSLMSEGQPVTVVGNIAQMSEENSKINPSMEDSNNNDGVTTAVGHPLEDSSQHGHVAPVAPVSHQEPINHVSDYDILALDLAGLKQLTKSGLPVESIDQQMGNGMPEGNYPQQITEEMEETPLIGESSASMLTGSDDNIQEFYKRGGKLTSLRDSAKPKARPNNTNKRKHKKSHTPKKTNGSKLNKRTMIGKRKGSFHENRQTKTQKQSRGFRYYRRKESPLSQPLFHVQHDKNTKVKVDRRQHLPKRGWKLRSETGTTRSKIEDEAKLDTPSKNDVLQSLLQPEIETGNPANDFIVSELINNIEGEVGEKATPLDEYLDELKSHSQEDKNSIAKDHRKADIARQRKTLRKYRTSRIYF